MFPAQGKFAIVKVQVLCHLVVNRTTQRLIFFLWVRLLLENCMKCSDTKKAFETAVGISSVGVGFNRETMMETVVDCKRQFNQNNRRHKLAPLRQRFHRLRLIAFSTETQNAWWLTHLRSVKISKLMISLITELANIGTTIYGRY